MGPTGEILTELQVLEADLAFRRDDFIRAVAVSEMVWPKLAEGTGPWLQVVGNLILMNAMSGRFHEARGLGHRLMDIEPAPDATAPYIEALAYFSPSLTVEPASQGASGQRRRPTRGPSGPRYRRSQVYS